MNLLFEYSLRVSHRAKHAKLLIKPYGGLEVVIPRRFPKYAVERLIRQHQGWITRQLEKRPPLDPTPELPGVINLSIDGSCTDITYHPNANCTRVDIPGQLWVKKETYQGSIRQLRRWIRREAWRRLPPMLDRLVQKTGLEYIKITIRSQKTRWGSCSSNGTISLNDQLLFVPHATAEYLMIHELCHRQHLNHSSNFWRLVNRHCPDYATHEAILNQARKTIPAWFMADLYR
ncbi:MAG: M48 family peptidase [Gammaproteobacteria bacterium]|nr:MAG: M48 family peptidase [Gammaproteobacteria bacterium]